MKEWVIVGTLLRLFFYRESLCGLFQGRVDITKRKKKPTSIFVVGGIWKE